MKSNGESVTLQDALTEPQIHGVLSAIKAIKAAEDTLVRKLREVGRNDLATNVEGNGGSKRGIIADIYTAFDQQLPAAAVRREAAKLQSLQLAQESTPEGDFLSVEVARAEVDLAVQQ